MSLLSPQRLTMLVFFLQPIAFGSWLPQIPDVQQALGLGPQGLAIALLGLPCGTLLTLPFAGPLVGRIGPRMAILAGFVLYSIATSLPAFAMNPVMLFVALMLAGSTISFVELGLNVQADAVEKATGSVIMTTSHGFWSVGIMVGSLIGSALAGLGLEAKWAILLVAENQSSTLRKISEIYDRIAFAGAGRYNEFDQLRVAGVRSADVKGYQYSRDDVDARSLANQYGQILGQIFTHEPKPMEVDILVAEVGNESGRDQLFHVTYEGTVIDEAMAEAMKDTPMYQVYQAVAPRPEDFGRLLDKIGAVMGDYDYTPEWANLQVPTLLVAGQYDKNAPPTVMKKMADSIPGSTYLEMKGVGHLQNLEAPDDFDGVILNFLALPRTLH